MDPSLTIAPAQVQQALAAPPFNHWTEPASGATWCSFHREPAGWRLRFVDLADFLVSADGLAVTACPTPGLDAATLEHLFLNQVLPLALSTQGKPVFHASAVALPAGTIAFVAASGRGKSTLATHFALHGAALVSDDGLLLEAVAGGFRVHPSHPSVRLWEDSRAALVGTRLEPGPPVSYSHKTRLLAGEGLPYCRDALPLAGAYFLGTGDSDRVRIEPMSPTEATLAWASHAFLLDVGEKQRLAGHFAQVTALGVLGCAWRLDYPRNYARLPEVRDALLAHQDAVDGAG